MKSAAFGPLRKGIPTARVLIVALALVGAAPRASSGVTEEEYAGRRSAVAEALDTAAVAIFRGADVKMRSADVDYRYRQESNLLYLAGINEPGITLILTGKGIPLDGASYRRFLLAGADARKAISSAGLFKDGLVLDPARLSEVLGLVLQGTQTLYLSMPDIRFVNDWMNNRPLFLDRDVRKELERRIAGLKVRSAGPLVTKLREIKSQAEIDLIAKSIAVTGDGLVRAMRTSGPGVFEYELQAAVEFEMSRQGAEAVGFPSIIGSGPNSLILHYSMNRRKMKEGEMVVMDVGAEVEGYSADVTRSIPIDGSFSREQRQVYTAVLDAQKAAIAAIRPGATFAQLEKIARESLALSGFAKYLTHGISHHLGLDTHDAGSLDTLRAGMVITVEPGAYIPANDTTLGPGFRGWGVRIEDDVLVTGSGNTVLSAKIPKEIGEIERIMRK